MSALEAEVKYHHAHMNLKLADLNEQISMANDKYVNSTSVFNQILERDFAQIKDAIMKYFIYQTSFLKNTEYDANNIIAVMMADQALEDDHADSKIEAENIETPFKMITTTVNDSFIDKIDVMNFEKSLQSQFKNAWNSFTSLFGNDESKPKTASVRRDPVVRQETTPKSASLQKDKDFLISTYESLVYAKSKAHGVTIKTMTKVGPAD